MLSEQELLRRQKRGFRHTQGYDGQRRCKRYPNEDMDPKGRPKHRIHDQCQYDDQRANNHCE